MLLTIFNLPQKLSYSNIKSLIQSTCGLHDLILDNLVRVNNTSNKVTVGLAEEEDAETVLRKLNGMYLDEHMLFVEVVKNKQKQPAAMYTTNQPGKQSFYYFNYEQGCMDSNQNQSQSMTSSSEPFGGSYDQKDFSHLYSQEIPYQSDEMTGQSSENFKDYNPNTWLDHNYWNPTNTYSETEVPQYSRSDSQMNISDDNSFGFDGIHERDRSPHQLGRDISYGDLRMYTSSFDLRNYISRLRGEYRNITNTRKRGRDSPPHDESAQKISRKATDLGNEASHPTKYQASPPKTLVLHPSQHLDDSNPTQLRKRTHSKQDLNVIEEAQSDRNLSEKHSRRDVDFDSQTSMLKAVHAQMPAPERPFNNTREKQLERAITWRNQAASSIAKEIINNTNKKNDNTRKFLQELKQVIRGRLEKLFGDDIGIQLCDMLNIYREVYNLKSDTKLYNQVRKKLQKQGIYPTQSKEKEPKKQTPQIYKNDHQKLRRTENDDLRDITKESQNHSRVDKNISITFANAAGPSKAASSRTEIFVCTENVANQAQGPVPPNNAGKSSLKKNKPSKKQRAQARSAKRAFNEESHSGGKSQPPHEATKQANKSSRSKPLAAAITSVLTGQLSERLADEVLHLIGKKILIEAWSEPDDDRPVPVFNGKPVFKDGVLKLWCADEQTLAWLADVVSGLIVSSGDLLVVRTQSGLPKPVLCSILIPNQCGALKDTRDIERALAFQNHWLDIRKWHLEYADRKGAVWLVVFSVTQDQVSILLEKERRISIGVGSVYVKFCGLNGKFTEVMPLGWNG